MAQRGENIYKRKDGRCEGRYIKGKDSEGKSIYSYVYSKTYSEAKEKLAKAKSDCIDYFLTQTDKSKLSEYKEYLF